jgi:DNA-binding transcriptional regulator YiaG
MSSSRRRQQPKKESYQREQVAGWRASGLSQAEFSRRAGISDKSLGHWKRRFDAQGAYPS